MAAQKLKQDEINAGQNIPGKRLAKGIGQTGLVRRLQLDSISMTREMFIKNERGIQHVRAVQILAIRDAQGTSHDELSK